MKLIFLLILFPLIPDALSNTRIQLLKSSIQQLKNVYPGNLTDIKNKQELLQFLHQKIPGTIILEHQMKAIKEVATQYHLFLQEYGPKLNASQRAKFTWSRNKYLFTYKANLKPQLFLSKFPPPPPMHLGLSPVLSENLSEDENLEEESTPLNAVNQSQLPKSTTPEKRPFSLFIGYLYWQEELTLSNSSTNSVIGLNAFFRGSCVGGIYEKNWDTFDIDYGGQLCFLGGNANIGSSSDSLIFYFQEDVSFSGFAGGVHLLKNIGEHTAFGIDISALNRSADWQAPVGTTQWKVSDESLFTAILSLSGRLSYNAFSLVQKFGKSSATNSVWQIQLQYNL